MEAVAEGLWGLADYQEKGGEIGKAVKCLEAICQSHVSFLPIIEIKTRLRIATLLLKHSNNVNHAKAHLERSQLLLKSIPSCFELKCRAYSLLSQCYQLVGAIPSQKQILNKGLELISTSEDGFSGRLWYCNFNSQLANALTIEGDHHASISALENGLICATQMCYPELQMFFATSILHVHLMQWENESSVQDAVNRCNAIWKSIESEKQCLGLLFYNELLHVFYLLRICDYKNAAQHVDKLDAAMKCDLQKTQQIKELTKELDAVNESLSRSDLNYRDRSALSGRQAHLEEQLNNLTGNGKEFSEPIYFGSVRRTWEDKLELAPPPIDGEWLPKGAIYALVDLTVVVFNRPKGLFKECVKRIQSGLQTIQEELEKLGISDGVREVDLQHSAIWISSVYLMLRMHFLENKVAVDLTRSEFIEAQEALMQMRNWYIRFPTILQVCECVIEMLRGQYAHCVGCYDEAICHFLEASRLSENKSMQAMCCVYAAISYICMGDAESSAKALDMIGPVLGVMDSFTGVREKTSVLLAHGFLLMRQQNLQEARNRLAFGLQTTHNTLGNLQLVSQYLTVLGNLALALTDTVQAREILRSSLTLAKKLNDIPTQIWVLSNLTALYQQLGEKGNEVENLDYQTKKVEDLQKRIADACSSCHHIELIAKVKTEAHQLSEIDIKRAITGPSMRVDLDIPESIGLSATSPMSSSTRLMDFDMGRLRKRKS
ncbi:sister chromatid cohesion protein SCC4-like isoform X2 [Nicotiana tabacum]|uniref:Sister chromatid cohesion protein SCC4-like isoform X2 n=2 Tax=Nicotiana TaxID=4085 RepID=A0AC58S232_TOBAC